MKLENHKEHSPESFRGCALCALCGKMIPPMPDMTRHCRTCWWTERAGGRPRHKKGASAVAEEAIADKKADRKIN